MCLLGGSMINNHSYGSKVPQTPNFGELNRHFKPNMRKIQTAISSDLCIRLTWNLTGTSWVVSYSGKTIPRWRTAAILKIDISPYRSVKSSDFHDVIKKWKSCIGQTPSSTERISCSKTTTLLPSDKCTRPLFQGRTGCGERPSGWHDIVTCQRLVSIAGRAHEQWDC